MSIFCTSNRLFTAVGLQTDTSYHSFGEGFLFLRRAWCEIRLDTIQSRDRADKNVADQYAIPSTVLCAGYTHSLTYVYVGRQNNQDSPVESIYRTTRA